MEYTRMLPTWAQAGKAVLVGAALGACMYASARTPVPSGAPSAANNAAAALNVSAVAQTKAGALSVAAASATPPDKLIIGSGVTAITFVNGIVDAPKVSSNTLRINGGDNASLNCAPAAGKVLKNIQAKDGTKGMGCWQNP